MQLKYTLILITLISSCKEGKPKVTLFKTQDFIIADTTIEGNKVLQFDNYMSDDYPIYYIGAQLDTIKIGKRYWKGRTQWTDNFKIPWSRKYSNRTLSILLDTTAKTNSPVEYFSDNSKVANDSTINYKSFLFLIKNISDSAVYLGQTFSVFFINREAKNRNGEWVKVDKKLSELGTCGTNEPTIILNPDEIVISKLRRYSGSFVTDFRLVLGYDNNIVYSNIFKDAIDERKLQDISTNK
jgi:hypothetical protein